MLSFQEWSNLQELNEEDVNWNRMMGPMGFLGTGTQKVDPGIMARAKSFVTFLQRKYPNQDEAIAEADKNAAVVTTNE